MRWFESTLTLFFLFYILKGDIGMKTDKLIKACLFGSLVGLAIATAGVIAAKKRGVF